MSCVVSEAGDVLITVNSQVATLTVADYGFALAVSQDVTQIVSVAQQGPMGPAGGATTTIINIVEASTTWTLAHYLNRYPTVTVVDTAGDMIWASQVYQDRNTIIINFTAPTSGVAYLN
ncbi:hypothetical protein [Beijerinckia sp. L45]|uniref:hypothetical protein n=1 Tax=Beijerinckia sp. L45 TaxID=1641855 RepID=UPI00131BDAF5|nr:hypothetical protein [Beijerinckia sp. L45]